MEATMNHYAAPRSLEELSETELYHLLNERLEEAHSGILLDFDTVFDELEARFCAYE